MAFLQQLNNLSGPSDELTRRLLKIAPPVITVALVVLLAWQLVGLTWLLVPRAKPEAQALLGAPPPSPSPAPRTDVVATIINAHLFGVYTPPPKGELSEEGPVIEAPKNLALKGTVAAESERYALAIIEVDGDEQVFALNEEVTSGRKLHRVEKGRVLLSRAGAMEELLLPKLSETGNSNVTRNNRGPSNNQAVRQQRIAQRISRNPAKLSDLIRPQPVFSNGKQLGYRVYPGRKREQFSALGLKPGDLVTEINGTPLDDPARGLEIFRSMNDTSQVSVTVERNGTPSTLVLDTSQIDLESSGVKK